MKVGIIGAGTMGTGIAHVFAQKKDYDIYLCDISEELAQNGKKRIMDRLENQATKGKLSEEECRLIINRITVGTKTLCTDCDLVIEAALEVMEVKQKTFEELHKICKPECIFATNTSALSVTEIGHGVGRPVIGMHFFNPAPAMKLVEVVVGGNTPAETATAVVKIAEDIGKVPIKVQESAGFVVNRILIPMINEAAGIYAEGIATAEDIDTAMKLGANHPMGPLALGDLVGLDICLAIMEVLHSEFGDPKYRPQPYLRKMVRSGRLGVKTGSGFYDYGNKQCL